MLAKENAKAILEVYADPQDYRSAQQNELELAVAAGKSRRSTRRKTKQVLLRRWRMQKM